MSERRSGGDTAATDEAAGDLVSVTVADGKYTIQQTAPGKWECLRYGEAWPAYPDGPGNLEVALAYEVAALRAQMRYWKRGTDLIKDCLAKSVRADHGDAPFPLDHTEARFWHNAQMEAYRHSLEMMGVPEDAPVRRVA
jgi:hypothetical protein